MLKEVLNTVKLQVLDVSAIKNLWLNTSTHEIARLLQNTYLIDFKCADYGSKEDLLFQEILENNQKKWNHANPLLSKPLTYAYHQSLHPQPEDSSLKELSQKSQHLHNGM